MHTSSGADFSYLSIANFLHFIKFIFTIVKMIPIKH